MSLDEENEADDRNGEPIERRRILEASAGAAVGAVGLAAGSGAAQEGTETGTGTATGTETGSGTSLFGACENGWKSAPDSYPYVDLTKSDPSTGGDFPAGEDEFLIYVHGWLEEFAGGAKDQGYTLEAALEANGYGQPTAAAVWNSNQPVWPLAKRNADRAGRRLASWIDSYLSEHPDTTIKTVDHSLGSRVILTALNELGGDRVLDNVSLIGAAVDPRSVCEGGEFYSGIGQSAAAAYNYHSRNDDIVCNLYRVAEFTEGLGCKGANCDASAGGGSPPDNYADVDVTDQVGAHCNYGKPDVGCVPQVVSNF